MDRLLAMFCLPKIRYWQLRHGCNYNYWNWVVVLAAFCHLTTFIHFPHARDDHVWYALTLLLAFYSATSRGGGKEVPSVYASTSQSHIG